MGLDIADNNTAIGTLALFENISGRDNTASGFKTLISNTTGGFNTATGATAFYLNTIGHDNTANGAGAPGLWLRTDSLLFGQNVTSRDTPTQGRSGK